MITSLVVILSVITCGLSATSGAAVRPPTSTEEVLRRWYFATGGPQWRSQHGWLEAFNSNNKPTATDSINAEEGAASPPAARRHSIAPLSWCTWYGVRCAEPPRYADVSVHRYITSLDLSDNNLVGEFPVALFCSGSRAPGSTMKSPFGFDQLTVLNVSHNQLSGSEPFLHSPGPRNTSESSFLQEVECTDATTPSLSTIEVIDMSWNRIKSSLRYVLHAHRRLHGTGRRMPRLRWLSMRSNLLYDPIAAVTFVQSQTANSASRRKSSTASTANFGSVIFPMLESFDAGDNHLIGEFPATSFAQHTPFLQVLKLDNNFFVNSALTWLAASLIGGNRADDADELRWHHTLTTLHLQYNYIQATIPNSVDRFTGLQELFLDGNRIYGTIPRELRSLRHLETLSLAHNYLRGTIPCAKDHWFSELTPFSRLRWMDFTDNELEGNICPVVPSHRIEVLRFADNAFRGAVPPLEGGRLREVTLGGENRWECDLPDPKLIPSWVDPAPSTKCILDSGSGDNSGGGIDALPIKRWGGGGGGGDATPSVIRTDATRRGSWWRNGLLGLLLPSQSSKKSDLVDAQPMGPSARHLFSVLLTLVVVTPLSAAFMKLAGVHLPQSPGCVPPGYHWFLEWIGYEPPAATTALPLSFDDDDDSDSQFCTGESDDEH